MRHQLTNPIRMHAAAIGLICLLAFATVWNGVQAETPRGTETTDSSESDPKDLMSLKLKYSQQILAGLVRGDFETIATSAGDLNRLSQQPQWDRFQGDPVYSHFTVEFQRIAQRLAGHAKAENLEAAAYTAQLLTSNCIACHQHVRDVKALPVNPE